MASGYKNGNEIDLNEGINITSMEVARPSEFSEIDRLEGKLVIVNSRKDGVKLIGRLNAKKVVGTAFRKMTGSADSPQGKHLIIDKYYRRDSGACYGIENQEEFDLRDMYYFLDEKKVCEIERYLAELSKFPFGIPLNSEDSL